MANKVTIRIGAINTASAVMGKVARDASRLGSSIGGAMQSAGASIGNLGRSMTLMGGAGVLTFAKITQTFASFDTQMKRVKAISGATGADFKSLEAKAKELGATTAFSASEAAEGMQFLAMAGFETDQILKGIGPTLALAAAGSLELGQAADIASDVGTAFGLAADEIGEVANVIARTATSANTDVEMMGETFKFVAPVAKAAGQSLSEVSAAAGLLGNAGVKASVAGTDLKNVLTNLATPAAQEKMQLLGVAVTDASGEFRPMMDILRDFGKQTADLTGPEKLSAAVDIFGKRSAKSALIIADAGDQIETMRAKMSDASVTAESMAETMLSGLGGAGVKIKSAFEGLSIAIIEGIKEPLMSAATSLRNFLSSMTKFVQQNPVVIKVIAALTLAITGIGIALTALGVTLGVVGGAVVAFGMIAGAVGTMLNVVWSPVTLIVIGVGVAFAALAAQAAIVGSVLLYLAAQGGVLTVAFEHIKNALKSFLETIRTTFKGVLDALQAKEYMLAGKILFAGLKVVFYDGLGRLLKAFQELMPMMWSVVRKFLLMFAEQTAKTTMAVAKALKNPFTAVSTIGRRVADLYSAGFSSDGLTIAIAKQRGKAQKELDGLVADAAEAASKVKETQETAAKETIEPIQPFSADMLETITPEQIAEKFPDLTSVLASSKLDEAIASNFVDGIEGVDMDTIMQNIKTGLQIFEDEAGDGKARDGDDQGGDAVQEDTIRRIQQQSLAAVSGRLMTRGRAADPVLEEQKNQTKILADIAKNTKPAEQAAGAMQGNANIKMEMLA